MMQNKIYDAMNTAGEGTEAVAEQLRDAGKGARSAGLNAIKLIVSGVALVRAFGLDDALGLVGLRRKSSPLASLVAFGAGVAVGAGIGMLLAPASGKETQRAIGELTKRAVKGAEEQVEEAAQTVGDKVSKVASTLETEVSRAMNGDKTTDPNAEAKESTGKARSPNHQQHT